MFNPRLFAMKIVFTPYEVDSRDYIFDSYVETMKHHIDNIWGWDETWQQVNFSHSLDKYLTFTLNLAGQKLGYIQLKHKSDYTYLSMIVLTAKYQSKGYGVQILKKIQSLKPNLPIKLRCFKVNKSAYNFYLQNGFTTVKSNKEFYTLLRK